MDGRHGSARLVSLQHEDEAVYAFQLLYLAGQAASIVGQSDRLDGPTAASDRTTKAGSDAELDGCPYRGYTEKTATPRRRYFLNPAIFGDAASLCGHSTNQAFGRALGIKASPGEGREDERHSVARPVMRYLHAYVEQFLAPTVTTLMPETPLFWSVWGRRAIGKHRAPMTGKISGGFANFMDV